jgi:hypothetical protein
MASSPQQGSQLLALSDFQQSQLWSLWIGAATRTLYFAILASRLSRWQNVIQGSTLVISGSAVSVLLVDPRAIAAMPAVAPVLSYAKYTVPLVVAAFNTVGLLKQYTKRSFECSELYQKWGRLEHDCQRLWGDMYDPEAPARLAALQEKALEISAPSTRSMPNRRRLMGKCQDEATENILAILGVHDGR